MKQGYKKTRTTVVLAINSKYLTTIQDAAVLQSLSKATAANYDLARLTDGDLEPIYGHFDDRVTGIVLGEYTFHPRLGNIRDNGAATATCQLCGKGDSRDDGANRDHIRYEFRLANEAGGQDVWCGSTCIINHALKVAGAGTAEEAKKLLERSFREHLLAWRREAWRAENPDHRDIPEQYERGRMTLRPSRLRWQRNEIALLGYSFDDLDRLYREVFGNFRQGGSFRIAMRYYQRTEWLTPQKHEAWDKAKQLAKAIDTINRALLDAQHITDHEARVAFFAERGRQLKQPVEGDNVIEVRESVA